MTFYVNDLCVNSLRNLFDPLRETSTPYVVAFYVNSLRNTLRNNHITLYVDALYVQIIFLYVLALYVNALRNTLRWIPKYLYAVTFYVVYISSTLLHST